MRGCGKLLRLISHKNLMIKEQALLKEMINATPLVSSTEIFKNVGKPDDSFINLSNFDFAVMKKRYEYVKENFNKIISKYDYIRIYVDPDNSNKKLIIWVANALALGVLGLYMYSLITNNNKYEIGSYGITISLSLFALSLLNLRMHNTRNDKVLQIIYNSKIDKLYIEKYKKIYGTYFQTLSPIEIKGLTQEYVSLIRPRCTYINRTTLEHYSTYYGRWINDEIFLYLLHRAKQPQDNYKLIDSK